MMLRLKHTLLPTRLTAIIFCASITALTYSVTAAAEQVWQMESAGDKYPAPIRKGVAQNDPEVIAGKFKVAGWVPVYIGVRTVTETLAGRNETWEEDAFTSERKADSLLAGCIGDFNGDGAKDYLLVVKRVENRDHNMFVFIAQRKGYRVMAMGSDEPFVPTDINDHRVHNEAYGPQTPECGERPKSGIYQPFEDEPGYRVVGDIVTFSWFSYFWKEGSFEGVLSSD